MSIVDGGNYIYFCSRPGKAVLLLLRGVAINNANDPKLTANPGYAAAQLAKAIAGLAHAPSGDDNQLAKNRARKWTDVLKGMANGMLTIGSREPVADTPPWITLEVVLGGFATGGYLAAGPLTKCEKERAERLKLNAAGESRRALNLSYLNEDGLSELCAMLDSGCFRVTVPEHVALLIVALLATDDRVSEACELLSIIEPWFGRLRFYPEPSSKPYALSTTVHLESVGEVAERLANIEEHERILTQNEALTIWLPLHDQFIQTVVNSCEHPLADTAEGLGELLVNCDDRWRLHATELLLRYAELRRVHTRSGKPERRGEVFFEIRRLVRKRLDQAAGENLSATDLMRVRELLRRDYAKRGPLNSEKRQALRSSQLRDGCLPTHAQAAKIACRRLEQFDKDSGLERPEVILGAELNDIERTRLFGNSMSPEQHFKFPESIERKVMRCLAAPVDELVRQGLIPSGDVLAKFVPQLAGHAMAFRFQDERVRRLYLQTYQAFRTRRSLLLFNLQKQVQFDELPWVQLLLTFSAPSYDAQQSPRQTLVDVAVLNLVAFPYAIVPNKLLQELRALAHASGLVIALVDELAADIFMGKFSSKFGEAVKLAAAQLQGTLYAEYYEINIAYLLRINFGQSHQAQGLAEICAHRAGVKLGSWSPASNGCVIEQQQILTTQNLATLWSIPEICERLEPKLESMIHSTFQWLLSELSARRPDSHSKLIAIKNAAYAWRQLLFYLSQLPKDSVPVKIDEMEKALAKCPTELIQRFRPVLVGLKNAANGESPESHGGKRLLGWSSSRHWFLVEPQK